MDKSLKKLAVLYADVSGSTRLYEQYGDTIARADMSACIQLLDEVCTGMSGEALKTIGDEIECAFPDPIKAALAASEMQASLRRAGEEGEFQMGILHIKVGWHYGKVAWRGNDLIGEAPVTAQQVIGLAKADEILTSKQAIDVLPDALFPDVHVINRIPAEAWDGEIVVYKMPWEQSGDETQIASKPHMQAAPIELACVLEYGDQRVRIDSDNHACVIGRGRQVTLQVAGRLTSRQHAQIALRSGRFNIRDESTNGTFIVYDDGTRTHLRREEDVLSGSGTIGFGSTPEDDPDGSIRFECSGGA